MRRALNVMFDRILFDFGCKDSILYRILIKKFLYTLHGTSPITSCMMRFDESNHPNLSEDFEV